MAKSSRNKEMSSRDKELRRLKCLIKIMDSAGISSKPTRRSGGIRGMGGDIISDDFLFEEKPTEMLTKAGQEAWDKIEEESVQRNKIPILVHGGLITMRLSDLSLIHI